MPSTNAITNITDIDELFARIEEYLTPEQVAFVRKAYELAAKAHAAQTRKSGEPYIIHPLAVADILLKAVENTEPMKPIRKSPYIKTLSTLLNK